MASCHRSVTVLPHRRREAAVQSSRARAGHSPAHVGGRDVAMRLTVKRGVIASGVVAILATVPLMAGADASQGWRHGRGAFMGGGVLGLRELGLTDDQRQQIRAAMAAHRDEFRAVAQRARAARQAQQAAIEQVPVNEPQIRAASSELAAAEADAAVLRARVHEQVFSLLTPEQQTKARALAAERRQRRAQRQAEWQQRIEKRIQEHAPQERAAPQE
jgi:Spy/CpxP family protein refolding chaperone